MRSRATESPAPHGDKAHRRDSEVKRGGGSEGAGGGGNVDQAGQIWWSEIMDGLECVKKKFEGDA